MTAQRPVFDIGMNNGDDSAYYLHLGFSVVGVEADPLLAARCSKRFEREIQEGRMKVVNAGVLRQPGEFAFYRSLQDDGWSTFERDVNRKPGEWEELAIRGLTTRQLIEVHGRPYFIKVDIEGADFQVLETLTSRTSPDYISLELNRIDPFIERLIELGYDAFTFVDGLTYHSTLPVFDHEWGWRLLRKAGSVIPAFHAAMCRLPESLRAKDPWNPSGKYSPDGYIFSELSSGPFGELAAGSWLPPAAATRWFDKLKSEYARDGRENIWWDVHARHSSVETVKGRFTNSRQSHRGSRTDPALNSSVPKAMTRNDSVETPR